MVAGLAMLEKDIISNKGTSLYLECNDNTWPMMQYVHDTFFYHTFLNMHLKTLEEISWY